MEKLSLKEAVKNSPGPVRLIDYIVLYLKGFLMGTADLVPGVSGGTVAIITGIYERLLNAISSFNKEAIKSLMQFDIIKFLSIIHIRFLIVLVLGIVSAIFSLARLMHFLITEYSIYTHSLFVGLVLASVVVICRDITNKSSLKYLALAVLGLVFAYYFVGLIPAETPESFLFLFLCGALSISAMILPGLSGSFVLLILGKYEYVMAAVKNPFTIDNLTIIAVFSAGIITGACIFTRILKWFFKNFKNATIALLAGILIGSIRKIWPWREVLETKFIGGKERIIKELNYLPDLNTETILALVIAIIGFVAVVVIERIAAREHP